MPEIMPNFENRETLTRELVDLETLEAMQKLAPKYNVAITVLQEEGEQYTDTSGYTGTVPKGKVYIDINNVNSKDLSEFWREVRERTKKQV